MSEIDAIVFDLGNVLLRVDEAIALRRFSEWVGKSPDEVARYFQTTPFATELALGKLTKRAFFRTVGNDLGFDGTYEEFAEIWSAIFSPIEPMIALAKGLESRLPRLLLSNTNIIHMEYIYEHFPFVSEFDQSVLSYEVGLLKPDASIYRQTLEAASLTPKRTLFIDDLPVNIAGACAVGMRAICYQNPEQVQQELTKLGVMPI